MVRAGWGPAETWGALCPGCSPELVPQKNSVPTWPTVLGEPHPAPAILALNISSGDSNLHPNVGALRKIDSVPGRSQVDFRGDACGKIVQLSPFPGLSWLSSLWAFCDLPENQACLRILHRRMHSRHVNVNVGGVFLAGAGERVSAVRVGRDVRVTIGTVAFLTPRHGVTLDCKPTSAHPCTFCFHLPLLSQSFGLDDLG